MLKYYDSTSSEISSISQTKFRAVRRKFKQKPTPTSNEHTNNKSLKEKQCRHDSVSTITTTDSETNQDGGITSSTEHESASEILSSAHEGRKNDESWKNDKNENNRNSELPVPRNIVLADGTTTDSDPTVIVEIRRSSSDSQVFDQKAERISQELQRNSRRPKSGRVGSNRGQPCSSKQSPRDVYKECMSRIDGKEKRESIPKKSKSCTVECDVLDPNYKDPLPRESSDDLFFFHDLDFSRITLNSGESSDYSIGFIFRDSDDDNTITLSDYHNENGEEGDVENEMFLFEQDRFDNSGMFENLEFASNTPLVLNPSEEISSQECQDSYTNSNTQRETVNDYNVYSGEAISSCRVEVNGNEPFDSSIIPTKDGITKSDTKDASLEENTTSLQTVVENIDFEETPTLPKSEQGSLNDLECNTDSEHFRVDGMNFDKDPSVSQMQSSVFGPLDLESNEVTIEKMSTANTFQRQIQISGQVSRKKREVTPLQDNEESEECFNMEEVVINCIDTLGLQPPIQNLNSNMGSVEFCVDRQQKAGRKDCESQQNQENNRRTPLPQEILEAIQNAMANGDFQDISCIEVDDDGVVMHKIDDSFQDSGDHRYPMNSISNISHNKEQIDKSVDGSSSTLNVENCDPQADNMNIKNGVRQPPGLSVNQNIIKPGTSRIHPRFERKDSIPDYQRIHSSTMKESSYLVANVMRELESSMNANGGFSPVVAAETFNIPSKCLTSTMVEICAPDIDVYYVTEDAGKQIGDTAKPFINGAAKTTENTTQEKLKDNAIKPRRKLELTNCEPTCTKELDNVEEFGIQCVQSKPPLELMSGRAAYSDNLLSINIPSDDTSNPDTIGSYGLASPKPPRPANKKLKGKKLRKRSALVKPDSSRSDVEQPTKQKSRTKFLSLLLNMMDDEKVDNSTELHDCVKAVKYSDEVKMIESEEAATEVKFPRGVDSIDPDNNIERNVWVNLMKEDMERTRMAYRVRRKQKPKGRGPSKKRSEWKRYKSKGYSGSRSNYRMDDWERGGVGYGYGNEDEEDSCLWGGEKNEFHPLSDEYLTLKDYYSQRTINRACESFGQKSKNEGNTVNLDTSSNAERDQKGLKATKSLPGLRISKAKVIAPSVIGNERIEHLKVEDTSNVKGRRTPGLWNYPSVDNYSQINRPIRGCSLESLTKFPGQNIPHVNSSMSIIQDVTSASFAHQKRLMYTDLLQANALRELNNNPQAHPDARCVESMSKRQKEIEMAEKVKQKLIRYRLNEAAARKKLMMSDEDQWSSTVNQMLLMSEKVKEQNNLDEDNRFPRSTSAKIVDAVPKKTFNFLNQLLEQDEQDQQLSDEDSNYSNILRNSISRFYDKNTTNKEDALLATPSDVSRSTHCSNSRGNTPTPGPSYRMLNHVFYRQRSQCSTHDTQHPFIKPDGPRAPISFTGSKDKPSSRVGRRHVIFASDNGGNRGQIRTLSHMGNISRPSSGQYDKKPYTENEVNTASVLKIRPRKYKPQKESDKSSENPLLNRYSDVFAYYHPPSLRDRKNTSIVQLYDN